MSPCVHAIPYSTDRPSAGPPPTPMCPVKSERAACCFTIINPICLRSKRRSPVVRLRGACAPSREPAVCSADVLLRHHYQSSRAELLALMSIPLCTPPFLPSASSFWMPEFLPYACLRRTCAYSPEKSRQECWILLCTERVTVTATVTTAAILLYPRMPLY